MFNRIQFLNHNIFVVCLISILLINSMAKAQESFTNRTYKNEFSLGFFQPFLGSMYLSYTRIIKRNSIGIGIDGAYKSTKTNEMYGYFIPLEYKRYIDIDVTSMGITRNYLSTAINYRRRYIDEYQLNTRIDSYGSRIIIGLNTIYFNRFTFDIMAGAGLKESNIRNDRSSFLPAQKY